MSEPVLLYEADGPLATITLNRPKQFNALDTALRRAMLEAVLRAEADPAVRIVILRGAGRGFCAGADLAEGPKPPVNVQIDTEYKPFLMAIANGQKLYIAQVHGSAAGIGAALAMNCDLVAMADDSSLYMAFAAIALIPDGGNIWLLNQGLGYRRAMEAIIEGRKIPAEECFRHGLANKVFTADTLEAETRAWALRLCQQAPLVMAAAKRMLRRVGAMSYSEAISAEGLEQNALLASADCKEGVTAFFEKRKAVFTGK